MHRVKSIVSVLIAAIMLQVLPAPAWSSQAGNKQVLPLANNAASAVLMDAYSGQILFSKEPHKRVAPASVTKVATMLVAIDAISKGKVKWDDRVVASEAAWELGGSQIWLEPGEEFSLRDLMIAIAVGSANDACVAVAEHIAGSQEAFVDLMNQKVKALGLHDTHFVNSYGLPAEGHYTSAYDMAVLAREALKNPELIQLTSIKRYDKIRKGRPILDNTNKLLWWYKGADGLKTGWTSEAKYCLVSTVERDHLRLICSLFGVPQPRGHFSESIKLYNWGYANYSFQELLPPGRVMGEVRVGKGVVTQTPLVTLHRIGMLVKKGEKQDLKTVVKIPSFATAPLPRGSLVGEVDLLAGGKVIDRVPLVTRVAVAKGTLGQEICKSFRLLIK